MSLEKAMQMTRPRVFSGIQPTGKLHIGNYIGALSVWAQEQDNFDGIYCIVDMHAFTIPEKISPSVLNEKIWETAAIYLAAGLDPDKSTIFIQSMVPQHAELAWYLTCATPVGWLERMTQYKTKSTGQDVTGTGLLTYPVLQAADILLYDTEIVPVGEDQKQHIEITRDIAQRYNNMFGAIFTLPKPLIREVGARIMGLDNAEEKMSKSIGATKAGHAIGVIDSPGEITKALRSAKTDSASTIDVSGASAGVKNLLTIYQALTRCDDQSLKNTFDGKNYGFLKREVTGVVIEGLRPLREEYVRLRADPGYLEAVVNKGAEKASVIAAQKMQTVKKSLAINFGTQPAPPMKNDISADAPDLRL